MTKSNAFNAPLPCKCTATTTESMANIKFDYNKKPRTNVLCYVNNKKYKNKKRQNDAVPSESFEPFVL